MRLSTFDPFGSTGQLAVTTPTAKDRKSPRLEARGSEPVPPPPPPRWCKPQLVPVANQDPPSTQEVPTTQDPEVVAPEVVETLPPKHESRRPVRRRRKPRRRRSSAPLSPQCHHSSLADKASDYEDIWGTSPGASHDEDDDPVPLANEEDVASLSDREEQEEIETNVDRMSSSTSSSSSNSTLEKLTSSASSSDRREMAVSSRSLTSSPEAAIIIEESNDEIRPPPSPFQEQEEQRRSVTIIEIRGSPPLPEENKLNNDVITPEVITEELPVRLRTNSTDSCRGETNSRRTSPLYSEPADALPTTTTNWMKNNQRPLPSIPNPPASSDFTTFTKDGYVRCTLPTPKMLPPSGQRVNSIKGKQVSMPKPPRLNQTPSAGSVVDQRKAFPSSIYLPNPGDDSITIQVIIN